MWKPFGGFVFSGGKTALGFMEKVKFFNDPSLFILIGIFINLWPITPSGNFYNNWLSALIYLPIGFYFYFNKKEKNA